MNPTLEPVLHRKASQWYELDSQPEEAISHALAAHDEERSAHLVQQVAGNTLWERGEVNTVQHWLEALSPVVLSRRPRLLLFHAWLLMWTNHLDEAELTVQKTVQQAVETLASDSKRSSFKGEVAALRANITRSRGDALRTIELAEEALTQLEFDEVAILSRTHAILGGAYRLIGDTVLACQSFERAYEILKRARSTHATLHMLGNLMQMQVQQGELVKAERTYNLAVPLIQNHATLPPVGIVYIARSGLLRERNDLEEAERLATQGTALCQEWQGLVEARIEGYLTLSRIVLATGDWDRASEYLRLAEDEANQYSVDAWQARVALERTRHWLQKDRLTAATKWAQGLLPLNSPETTLRQLYLHHDECLMAGRILLAQGRLQPALEWLKRLREAASSFGLVRGLTHAIILEAKTRYLLGNHAAAVTQLRLALSTGVAQTYIRLFVEEGEVITTLLDVIASEQPESLYVDLLRSAAGRDKTPPMPSLSKRELQQLSGRLNR